METRKIPRATRDLGKPLDWDEAKHGPCGSLPIRDVRAAGGQNAMLSHWQPDAEELARLNAGAPVTLWVYGEVHPPVSITVGLAFTDDPE